MCLLFTTHRGVYNFVDAHTLLPHPASDLESLRLNRLSLCNLSPREPQPMVLQPIGLSLEILNTWGISQDSLSLERLSLWGLQPKKLQLNNIFLF